MVELFEFIIQTLFLKGGSWLNCSNLSFKPWFERGVHG